jgi:hypothetical protein
VPQPTFAWHRYCSPVLWASAPTVAVTVAPSTGLAVDGSITVTSRFEQPDWHTWVIAVGVPPGTVKSTG